MITAARKETREAILMRARAFSRVRSKKYNAQHQYGARSTYYLE